MLEGLATMDLAARLGSALVIGSAIGLDRDLRNKPAGMRTQALVALGAAVITIACINAAGPRDPGAVSRVLQGIITGVGFLGGGVILHAGDREGAVVGLTTAASVWVVACLGAACGAGQWELGLLGAALSLAVLKLGHPFEKAIERIFRRRPQGPPKTDL
ncbi:MAG TPA: MgtC/SapB family protein [Acidobacteriota bacterium]|nr:MgtC/SapB family protein [Acidobacteriota bacterium]